MFLNFTKSLRIPKDSGFFKHNHHKNSEHYPRFRSNFSSPKRFIHSDKAKIHISNATDPYWNIAFEEYLLQRKINTHPESTWMYLWRNKPVLVIGRNQNPWIECDLNYLRSNNISLLRRNSGGGAVYHDLGNMCITFFTQSHQPSKNLQFVVDALNNTFNVNAYASPRNDLFFEDKKISGSAFRVTQKSSYHHLTVLCNSNLDVLSKSLLPTVGSLESKATQSVRSKVGNLSDRNPNINQKTLFDAMIAQFHDTFPEPTAINNYTLDDIQSIPEVQELYQKFVTWDWIFGNTPRFTQTISQSFGESSATLKIHCMKGIITEVNMESPIHDPLIELALKKCMENEKYHPQTLRDRFDLQLLLIHDENIATQFEEVARWILEHVKM